MAVPTITTISPATGPAAGGQLVTITGTNFQVPTLTYDVPQDDLVPTVAVTINGRSCLAVRVISATEVVVLTPRYYRQDPRNDSFDPVDVVLSNVDLDGNVIAGETVTETDGFTYKRWETGAPRYDPPVTRIVKEVMWALALEVEEHVYRVTHVDYGEEGSAVRIAQAELPSINVTLSQISDPEYGAGDYSKEAVSVDKGDGTYDIYEGAKTVMAVMDLLVAGETGTEAEHMCQSISDFCMVHPEVIVPADPLLYPGEEDSYAIEIWREPLQISSQSESGMVVFSMELRLRGIKTIPDDPTMNVKPWTTATLTTMHMDADDQTADGVATHVNLIEP